MRTGGERLYVDPVNGEPLVLAEAVLQNDEVVSGVLKSASGHEFPIVAGVPNLVYPVRIARGGQEVTQPV